MDTAACIVCESAVSEAWRNRARQVSAVLSKVYKGMSEFATVRITVVK